MMNWRNIVPNRELGLLPTLGDVSVRMRGNIQLLSEGEGPRFKLDEARALQLLRGENLYGSPFACIREALQNAVDATLICLWLTKGRRAAASLADPTSQTARDILDQRSIDISLVEDACQSRDPKKSVWLLTIEDRGTGISRSDLVHMLRVGGSQGNASRRKLIGEMPEWMKPSGSFGIGFQSVFMLCESLKILTKSILTNETLEIEVHSPSSDREGLVVIRQLENDVSQEAGTLISMRIELDAVSQKITWHMGDDSSLAGKVLGDFDPVLDEKLSYEAASILDSIDEFSKNSLIAINATFGSSELQHKSVVRAIPGQSSDLWRYIRLEGDEVRLQLRPHKHIPMPRAFATYYRGQPFEGAQLFIPYASVAVDIMSGKAGSWLGINRDKILSNATDAFDDLALKAIEAYVRQDIKIVSKSGEHAPNYSLFLAAMSIVHGDAWPDLSMNYGQQWTSLCFSETNTTYKSFLESEGGILGERPTSDEIPLEGCDFLVESNTHSLALRIFLKAWLSQTNCTVQARAASNANAAHNVSEQNPLFRAYSNLARERICYSLRRVEQSPYTNDALAATLVHHSRSIGFNQRVFLDCPKFPALKLKDGLAVRGVIKPFIFERNAPNTIMLPFLFLGQRIGIKLSDDMLSDVVKWTETRLAEPSPQSVIKRNYEDLITYVDEEIMRNSSHWEVWKTARGMPL